MLLIFGSALKGQTQKNSIQFRTENSDVVIEGKVVKCLPFWNDDHTQIFTSNLIEVSKVFKGKSLNVGTIEIITLGGVVEERFSIVSHQRTFKPGMEGIFFCKSNQKLPSRQQFPEASFLLSFTETGFVQYFFERFNPPAVDASKSYKDIPKEIYNEIVLSAREPVRRIKANTVEEKLQGVVNILPDQENLNTTAITFSFENVSLTNNFQNISFDVYVKSSENGLKFGKALVLINYSSDVFGESVVANQNISISKGTVLQNSAYSLSSSDQDVQEVLIDVTSNFLSPSDAYTLTTVPEQFCHIDLTIDNFFALANIGFDDFQMSGNSWFYDTDSKDYVLFDRVVVENPIIKTNVENPAYVFYHLDSICVTSDATNMYLEFDILASSNVTWTRLSIADIFLSYNTLGFNDSPNANFSLDPEFDNLGYSSSILPYPPPANLLQITVSQDDLDDSTKHVPMGLDPKRIGRMKIEVKDCHENAGIYFVDTLMNGLQFYYGGVPIPLIAYDFGEEGNPDYYDQYLCIPDAPIITSIYPKDLRAGVFEVLTVEGKNLKMSATENGRFYFRSAKNPIDSIYSFAFDSDVITWTDTLIEIYVPSDLEQDGESAASGKIVVENALGKKGKSDESIIIQYSITNVRDGDEPFRISFVNADGDGGYTFKMDDELISLDPDDCINSALNEWACKTKINWKLSSAGIFGLENAIADGNSTIILGDSLVVDSTTALAFAVLSGTKECDAGLSIAGWHVDDLDIVVNKYNTFQFECDSFSGNPSEDFYAVLVHELGHLHMLEHSVHTSNVIYNYAIGDRSPSGDDIAGGLDVIAWSSGWTEGGDCPSKHEPKDCITPIFEIKESDLTELYVYPNPFQTSFFLERNSINEDYLRVYVTDVTGKTIFTDSFKQGELKKEVSISSHPPGLYFLNIRGAKSAISLKLIKLN